MHNIEAADLREVPKNRSVLWALDAYYSKRLRVYTLHNSKKAVTAD